LRVEKLTSTFLENQRGFGANITPVSYSKVYHDATFEPVSVTIGPILMKFWLFVAGCCLLLGVEKVTSTSLRNQRGFEANLTPVSYSKMYHDATFEPVSVTIGSILMKFWLLGLVVVCCWGSKKSQTPFSGTNEASKPK